MIESHADKVFEWLAHAIDPQSKLVRCWPLQGGVSAEVTALEIKRQDGRAAKMVVRRHGAVDRQHNPQIAADEYRLLQILQAAGLPAPKPYFLDQSGKIFPTPCLVVEYVEGAPEFAPANLADLIVQLATQLARIHTLDCAAHELAFLPQQEQISTQKLRARPARLDESLDEGRIRAALETAWPRPQQNPSVLLHGDFWPGNTLWQAGRLVAIIDWEDAKIGDPLADLANTRLEILWAFGIDAMQNFTRHYRSLTTFDFTNLPYWDLYAALRPAFKIAEWAGTEAREQAMRAGHRQFIAQAFAELCTR